VKIPVALSIKNLVQVFPDPGYEARARVGIDPSFAILVRNSLHSASSCSGHGVCSSHFPQVILTLCPFYIHLDDDGVLLDDFQKLLKP